jgi:hypothetical protein
LSNVRAKNTINAQAVAIKGYAILIRLRIGFGCADRLPKWHEAMTIMAHWNDFACHYGKLLAIALIECQNGSNR